MSVQSRTTNTFYNFASSMGGQALAILMNFVTRTVFIATLGKSYLGISGLFSNILIMLSLAEFGVGNAILYKLYDPIAKKDHRRITVLVRFYKSAYHFIGVLVAVTGLCMLPFLPLLIKDYDKLADLNINPVLIFCLYLLKTVSSYLFFAYRSTIIEAHQKAYVVNLVSYVFTLCGSLVQIVCMYLFRSFVLYVSISILQVIGQNYVCARIADRMYPYIREKSDDKLDWREVREIFKDCGALFLYKMNNVVLKGTDNVVISSFLGLGAVGEYSNYYIFYTTINSLFIKVYNAMAHSLGNLHVSGEREHEYSVFEAVMLITAILGGTAGTGVFVCADDFLLAWIGSDWLIPQPFSLLMGLEVYTLAFRIALSKYRNAMGLFQQAKFRPLAGMLINLIVSVGLVRSWGICGVLAGTIIADWSTMMWFDPIIIHRYGFRDFMPVKRYFGKFSLYFLVVCTGAAFCRLAGLYLFPGHGWFSVILHGVLCCVIITGLLQVLTHRTEEGKYVLGLVRKYLKKLRRFVRR